MLTAYVGLEIVETQRLYIETSQQMDKWIGILDFAFLIGTPIVSTWPALVVSCSKYFTTDLGGSALELPYPIW